MFINHFNMTGQPFNERISTDHILKDNRVNQALARLQYFLTSGTIALITGQTGSGKSSLIKLFLNSLDLSLYNPVYIYITDLRVTSILKLIVSALNENPKHTKGLVFSQIVDLTRISKTKILFIIDEAHLLSSESLTDFRLIVSSALDESSPIKILLSGQEHLRQILRRPHLADLAHRISVHYKLKPFTKPQTHAYIDHHLRCVNANENIFSPQVKDLIHEFAGGLPRQINNIATACLLCASLQKVYKIDRLLFSQAASDCRL